MISPDHTPVSFGTAGAPRGGPREPRESGAGRGRPLTTTPATDHVGASQTPAGAGPGPAWVMPPGAAPRSPGGPWKLRVAVRLTCRQRLAGAHGGAGGPAAASTPSATRASSRRRDRRWPASGPPGDAEMPGAAGTARWLETADPPPAPWLQEGRRTRRAESWRSSCPGQTPPASQPR